MTSPDGSIFVQILEAHKNGTLASNAKLKRDIKEAIEDQSSDDEDGGDFFTIRVTRLLAVEVAARARPHHNVPPTPHQRGLARLDAGAHR